MHRNNATLLPQLQLHLIVFIWGFTAILGELITLKAAQLVWLRMLIAVVVLLTYLKIKGTPISVTRTELYKLVPAGSIIALHWVTFFYAIKISTVSLTLACMASGAFFAALLEPLFFKKRWVGYELLLGLVVVICLWLIFDASPEYGVGMLVAIISAFLSALFAVINGVLVKTTSPAVITLYELSGGWVLLSAFLLFAGGLNAADLQLTAMDWVWMVLLGTVCTTFAFIISVAVMRVLSPFTVMLTINLEPVYGIVMAYLIFGEQERMTPIFYVASFAILATVALNAYIKRRQRLKSAF